MKRIPIKGKDIFDALDIKIKSQPAKHVVTLDLALDKEDIQPASLRFAAKLAYVTSLKNISLQKLSNTPPFDKISLGEISRWANADKWTAEREKYKNRLEKRILNKLATQHLDSIVDQLQKADDLSATMYSILDSSMVPPKSFEGMVSALMKLEDFRFSTREKVAQLLSNQIQVVDEGDDTLLENITTPKVSYNEDALMQLAHTIIKKERDANKNAK